MGGFRRGGRTSGKGLGFLGGMDKDSELEEGEARPEDDQGISSGLEEGEASPEDHHCVDPDSFSYIDEQIQFALRHCQKDCQAGAFEGNLGTKLQEYGSFLPTYKRYPIFGQYKSLEKVQNQKGKKSPCNISIKATNWRSSDASSSVSITDTVAMPLLDNICGSYMVPTSQITGGDPKTLKLRIKVGPVINMARNTAAIYSGLGLDSLPSSPEDCSDGSEPQLQDIIEESPRTIIQVMTAPLLPDGILVSPLQDCLSQFVNNFNESNEGNLQKARSETNSKLEGWPKETKNSEDNDNDTGQEHASNPFNTIQLSSSLNVVKKADGQMSGVTEKLDTNLLSNPLQKKWASMEDKSRTIHHGAVNSVKNVMLKSSKLNARVGMTEKVLEPQILCNQKDGKPDLQREENNKAQEYSDATNTHVSEKKKKNTLAVETADQIKPNSSLYRLVVLQGQDYISDRKKKVKASQTNSESFLSGNSTAALRERKKSFNAGSGHAENSKGIKSLKNLSDSCSRESQRNVICDVAAENSKGIKSLKNLSDSCSRESQRNVNCDVAAENLENGVVSQNRLEVEQKAEKRKHEESIVTTQTFKKRSSAKKIENKPTSGAFASDVTPAPITCNVPTTGTTIALEASNVIQESWVGCDICQKWRLLPYGTDPGHLPAKWQCSLLNWLPGMNSCQVSEDETTNALHALYGATAPQNTANLDGDAVAASSTALVSGVHLSVHTTGKKRTTVENVQSISTWPNSVEKDSKVPVMLTRVNDAIQNHPAEIKSSDKGASGNLRRSTDINVGKHKPNHKDEHKNYRCSSAGGDHGGKGENHSKSGRKVEVDQDDVKASKKLKAESLHVSNKDCSNHVFDKSDNTDWLCNSDGKCRLDATSDSRKDKKDCVHEKNYFMKKQQTSKRIVRSIDDIFTSGKQTVLPIEKKDSDSRASIRTRCGRSEYQATPVGQEKSLRHHDSVNVHMQQPPVGLGKSRLKLIYKDKQENQAQVVISSYPKVHRPDIIVDAVKDDTSEVYKRHRQQNIHNGLRPDNLRYSASVCPDTSTALEKENSSSVLREARDLKNTADRLKDEGLVLESTGLYFEAALEFLHVASLMEPVNFDIAKQAEAAQLYSETAKLCEFVAYEYKKMKNLAAAALAFKCVEVAYLKTAYCKNHMLSRDPQELQTALRLLSRGESPSSSASDIDNLNNQVGLGQSVMVKCGSSPQVAANHVTATRCQRRVMRLIHYMNDLNCAFEATRKSQDCVASASCGLDKDKVDSMTSVKVALDFSFHNIEGLLHLLRLSLQALSH